MPSVYVSFSHTGAQKFVLWSPEISCLNSFAAQWKKSGHKKGAQHNELRQLLVFYCFLNIYI